MKQYFKDPYSNPDAFNQRATLIELTKPHENYHGFIANLWHKKPDGLYKHSGTQVLYNIAPSYQEITKEEFFIELL
jgi:hypothetical protein